MKKRRLSLAKGFVSFVMIVVCLVINDIETTKAYTRPRLFVEPGSPLLSTDYPEGMDLILDSDDFYAWESIKQYYDARGFDYYAKNKDQRFANAYTTVYPSLQLRAELGELNNTIRSFTFKGREIYICQEYKSIVFNGKKYSGQNVLLSRCKIVGDSFSRKDSMLLTNVGDAATLETYKYDGERYFWIGCGSVEQTDGISFSTELGRIKYNPGTVLDSERIERVTNIGDGDANDPIKYVESALSSDKKRMIIHQRSFYGKDSFSIYDFQGLNELLSSANYNGGAMLSEKEIEEKLLERTERPERMPVSLKGIELSNESRGRASVYFAAGNDADDNRLLKLYKYDTNGTLKGQLIVSDVGLSSVWGESLQINPCSEINGLQIKGRTLQFAIRDLENAHHQLILSIEKDTIKNEGHAHGPKTLEEIEKEKSSSDKESSKITYSLKKGKLTVSGNGPMDKVYAKDRSIREVVIERGITLIPENAFYGCTNLKKVVLPKEGLKKIESGAFANTSVKELLIPESVDALGYGALYSKKMKSITLPSSFIYTATGKASENYPRTIGFGDGCTIRFRFDPEETNVLDRLVAESILVGDYPIG